MKIFENTKRNVFVVTERTDIKTTILRPRTTYFHECPHCHNEIYEKHTYVEFLNEDKTKFIEYHSDCQKPIKFKKTDQESIELEKIKSFFK